MYPLFVDLSLSEPDFSELVYDEKTEDWYKNYDR